MRYFRRITLGTVLLAVTLLLGIQVYAWVFRIRAEHLLAALRTFQVEKTPASDVLKLRSKYRTYTVDQRACSHQEIPWQRPGQQTGQLPPIHSSSASCPYHRSPRHPTRKVAATHPRCRPQTPKQPPAQKLYLNPQSTNTTRTCVKTSSPLCRTSGSLPNNRQDFVDVDSASA
jgi:hypothetical protein